MASRQFFQWHLSLAIEELYGNLTGKLEFKRPPFFFVREIVYSDFFSLTLQ